MTYSMRTLRIKEDLGAALRCLRARRGMTQGEVSGRGGCTTAMLSSYEKGHKAPSFETLTSLRSGLGCDLSDLQEALSWAREPREAAGSILPERLGPALLSIRTARRETQAQVAERAGVAKAMVSAYEKERQVPSLPVLDRLMEALEVDFADLQGAMKAEAEFLASRREIARIIEGTEDPTEIQREMLRDINDTVALGEVV